MVVTKVLIRKEDFVEKRRIWNTLMIRNITNFQNCRNTIRTVQGFNIAEIRGSVIM